MDKDLDMKLEYIKNKFIANEKREKEERTKKNKEETKEIIIMIIIFAILFGISFWIISLGYFITKLIGFIMILGLLGYLCIGDE